MKNRYICYEYINWIPSIGLERNYDVSSIEKIQGTGKVLRGFFHHNGTNDVTGGTSLALEDMAGNAVTHDGLAARDEITGRWRRIMQSGTTCDSVIVQSVV